MSQRKKQHLIEQIVVNLKAIVLDMKAYAPSIQQKARHQNQRGDSPSFDKHAEEQSSQR